MIRKVDFTSFCLALLTYLLSFYFLAHARAEAQPESHARALISQKVDESKLVTLNGNMRPEAIPENDRGPVADGLRMEHMLLQLRRPPELENELQQFIDQLHNPASPNFHKWLGAQQFGESFGLAQQDLDTITHWLEAHGFTVNVVYPSGVLIDFSGTAAQVRAAFHTEIHSLTVNGASHIANVHNPQIPAALAPAVLGIVSLHDFRPHPMHKMRAPPNYTFGSLFGSSYAVVPADLATIYNLNPLFRSGTSGQGQTIVVIEDTNVYSTADWTTFRSTFGLSSYSSGSFAQVHPAPSSGTNNCRNPGVLAPNDAEAILDAEYASAAAPSAAIELASCADTSTTFGGLIAAQNLINASSTPPAVMSISYGECETMNGATANAAYNSTYQQAVTEGVSVFVAAGDSGAAGCDNGASQATHGIAVNAFASTPYNVAVGGTDYSDTYSNTNSIYWNSTNTSTFGSATSYIPEIPWNDSCAGVLLANYEGYSTTYGSGGFCNSLVGGFFVTTASGGGGPSGCATGTPTVSGVVSGTCQGWPKPPWQSVLGNPSDGVRDTPDISLFAADGLWSHYYVFCWSDAANGGTACTGTPDGWSGAGGTSFASPIMAGIQALINQSTGQRQGNPNPVYYQLAAAEYGPSGSNSCKSSNRVGVGSTCIFYDVTEGDMDVDCTGSYNCYSPSGTGGVLSTSNLSYSAAYGTTTGWDFATGIGSLNATNLVNDWPTPSNLPVLSITKTHTGNFTQGQQHATYTVTVSNRANAAPTSGTVTVTDIPPSGLTLVSMTGTGWTCAASNCTRSDALNGGE
ncbi:MAG TPA: protease pro-enzyme activation domain-containing protein, partial [Terriglobales bacterium]|nr:protease pro-enzyme activation domain-containing protein [Terriglobales bacterium]